MCAWVGREKGQGAGGEWPQAALAAWTGGGTATVLFEVSWAGGASMSLDIELPIRVPGGKGGRLEVIGQEQPLQLGGAEGQPQSCFEVCWLKGGNISLGIEVPIGG